MQISRRRKRDIEEGGGDTQGEIRGRGGETGKSFRRIKNSAMFAE
jgi:hypothetical protein